MQNTEPAGGLTGQVRMTGVNLAGAEFGAHLETPGTLGVEYEYPTPAEVDYYVGHGMNVVRVCFLWERVQRTLFGEFDATEFELLDAVVRHATNVGAYAVLDPHNYARRNGEIIGTGDLGNEAFADFWTRLATHYKDDEKVLFNLVNEPYKLPSTEHWLETANAAIAAIRATGATNLILVPGVQYTGAHSWTKDFYGRPNAEVMLGVEDPADHYAYDVHQYLDVDCSGTHVEIVSPTIGAERLAAFTEWARAHGKQGFLGEFAVANVTLGPDAEQPGQAALDHICRYMAANRDVWIGWTWWAGGPRWNNYMFDIHPRHFGTPQQQDRPVLGALKPWFHGSPIPTDAPEA